MIKANKKPQQHDSGSMTNGPDSFQNKGVSHLPGKEATPQRAFINDYETENYGWRQKELPIANTLGICFDAASSDFLF